MDAYIGEIRYFAFGYTPVDWLACDGAIYPMANYQALYALIGNTYGGDYSKRTFAVPDMRSRLLVGTGIAKSGTTNWTVAKTYGQESVVLTQSQTPVHTHGVYQYAADSTDVLPANGRAIARFQPGAYFGATGFNTNLAPNAVSIAGSQSPVGHENRQPFLALQPCIATTGEFPVSN